MWYFWENDIIYYTSILNQDLEHGKLINGGCKFLEIKVKKVWVLMIIIDWNVAGSLGKTLYEYVKKWISRISW